MLEALLDYVITPAPDLGLWGLLGLYTISFIARLPIAYLGFSVGNVLDWKRPYDDGTGGNVVEDMSIREHIGIVVIAGPIIEEVLFRGIVSSMYWISGGADHQLTILAIVLTGVWAVSHGPQKMFATFISGIVLLKLWLSGYWAAAIGLHMFNNLWPAIPIFFSEKVLNPLRENTSP